MDPIQLLDLTKHELQMLLTGWGEPPYRADQIWGWLYRRFAVSPEDMTDLPKSLRTRLAAETCLDPLMVLANLDSSDGQTHKTLFSLPDGPQVEARSRAREPQRRGQDRQIAEIHQDILVKEDRPNNRQVD